MYKANASECSMDVFKSVKISIGTVMKNPEMLKYVPNHIKTKRLCENAVKKLPLVMRYVPD